MDQKLIDIFQKKRQQPGTETSIDWDSRRDEYLAAVQNLYEQIRKILAEAIDDRTITLTRRTKQLTGKFHWNVFSGRPHPCHRRRTGSLLASWAEHRGRRGTRRCARRGQRGSADFSTRIWVGIRANPPAETGCRALQRVDARRSAGTCDAGAIAVPVPPVNAENAEPQTLDEILDWHRGIVEALVDQRGAVQRSIQAYSTVAPRFVGMTEAEVDTYYDVQRRELERLTMLNLVASAEAAIRDDYSRRVGGKLKDLLARRLPNMARYAHTAKAASPELRRRWHPRRAKGSSCDG